MGEKIRVRCPFCGMLPEAERILETEEPREIQVILQRFGGSRDNTEAIEAYEAERNSRPSKKGRKKKIPRTKGSIEYFEIDDPETKSRIHRNLKNKIDRWK